MGSLSLQFTFVSMRYIFLGKPKSVVFIDRWVIQTGFTAFDILVDSNQKAHFYSKCPEIALLCLNCKSLQKHFLQWHICAVIVTCNADTINVFREGGRILSKLLKKIGFLVRKKKIIISVFHCSEHFCEFYINFFLLFLDVLFSSWDRGHSW